MPNQKVLVKKIFYNVCMARRLGGLQMSYFKKKKVEGKRNQTPSGIYESNLSATLIFFLTSNVKEAVCEASLLIFS